MDRRANIANKIFRCRGGNDDVVPREMQNNCPMRVGNKGAICSERLAVKPASEGEQAAVAKCANAPTHRLRLDLCRMQTSQRKSGRPEQAVNENRLWSGGITANREEYPAADNRKWKQAHQGLAARDKANRDADADKRGQ